MQSRGAHAKQQRRTTILAVILLITAGVIALSIYSLAEWQKSQTIILGEDLCPVKSEPVSYDFILLDLTSPLNPLQRAAVKGRLREIKDSIRTHGQIAIYLVRERIEDNLVPVVSLCNPGKGSDLNKYYQNPELALKRWQGAFDARIDAFYDEVLNMDGQRFSPIMEAIQAVKVTGIPTATQKPIRIHVFSDLLQHTEFYSHYVGHPPDFGAFRETSYARRVQTDLEGASVWIHYLNRTGAERVQGREHKEFWNEFFHYNHAVVQGVKNVEG